MSLIKNLRGLAAGTLDEDAFAGAAGIGDAGYDFEGDEEFMQECAADCLELLVEMAIMEDTADALDEDVRDAVYTIQNYLQGQGVISEAAAPTVSKNSKKSYTFLSLQAKINRLISVIILKMGRKNNDPAYRKYKIGQKIKKENMAILRKKYEAKATKLANKLRSIIKKNGKAGAVVESKKAKQGGKK